MAQSQAEEFCFEMKKAPKGQLLIRTWRQSRKKALCHPF